MAATETATRKEAQIPLGLVGYGNIGRDAHAPVLTAAGSPFRLVGIADPALKESPLPGVRLYPSAQAMFGDRRIQAVSITTPPDSHASLAMEALKNKHVAVEKPPAQTLDELQLMVDAATTNNRVLFTAFHARYGASATEARRLLKGKKITNVEIDYAENVGRYHDLEKGWVLKKDRNGGGVLMDSGINALSVVAAAIGEQFTDIHVRDARFSKPEGYINTKTDRPVNFETETRAQVSFSFGDGGVGLIQQEWLLPEDQSERRIIRFTTANDGIYEVDIIHKTISRNGLIVFDANAHDLTRVDRIGEYSGVLDHFAKSIHTGESFVESGALGLITDAYQASPAVGVTPIDIYQSSYSHPLPRQS